MLVVVAVLAWIALPDRAQLARALLDAGDVATAGRLIERASTQTTDPDARAELAAQRSRLALMQGDVEGALAQARAVVALSPGRIASHVQLAELAEALCRPDEAHASLARATDLHRTWRARGRPELARQATGVVTIDGDALPTTDLLCARFEEWFRPHRRRLAWYQRWKQQLPEALATTRALVEDDPADYLSWVSLARLEAWARRPDASRAALDRAIALRPGERSLREILAFRYIRARQPERAAEHLQHAQLQTNDTAERLLLGYARAGRGEDGVAEFQRRFPGALTDLALRRLLARIAADDGDPKAALAILRDTVRRYPDDERANEELGVAQLAAHEWEPALRTFLALHARRPTSGDYLRGALAALDSLKREKEALTLLEKLARLEPTVAHRRDLGLRYAYAQRHRDAEPLLAEARRADADDEEVAFQHAIALKVVGRMPEAAAILRGMLDRGAVVVPAAPVADAPVTAARRVLALYRASDGERPDNCLIHFALEVPLNWLGLAVDYRDAEGPLPSDAEMERYRGVVTWFHGEQLTGAERYADWAIAQVRAGRPLVVMEDVGCTVERRTGQPLPAAKLDELWQALGFRTGHRWTDDPSLIRVVRKEPEMVEFERPLAHEVEHFREIESLDPANRIYLELKRTDRAATCAAVLTGPRASICLESYACVYDEERHRSQWRLNPFLFLARALHLDGLPRVDLSTRCGLRLAYHHVDGDGSNELVRWKPDAIASEVFFDTVLKRDLPWTVSFIGALVDPERGVPRVHRDAARKILAHPLVEPAHHSYSHPFDWAHPLLPGLEIPGYNRVDMRTELLGAARAVDALCPPGKRTRVVLWSGLANPTREMVDAAESDGLLNLNGEGSRVDPMWPSLLHTAAAYRQMDGATQYHSSAHNDFAMTDRWRLPVAAFESVLHTFLRTGAPRRLIPVNVYIHFYLIATTAGQRVLDHVLDWVERQPLHHIFVSDWVRTIQGFRAARVERAGDRAFRVRDYGVCSTVRFDGGERPDLARSVGVLGYHRAPEGTYVHLEPNGDALVALGDAPAPHPWIDTASAQVSGLSGDARHARFTVQGHGTRRVTLAGFPPGLPLAVHITGPRGPSDATCVSDPQGRAAVQFPMSGTHTVEIRPETEEAPRGLAR